MSDNVDRLVASLLSHGVCVSRKLVHSALVEAECTLIGLKTAMVRVDSNPRLSTAAAEHLKSHADLSAARSARVAAILDEWPASVAED